MNLFLQGNLGIFCRVWNVLQEVLQGNFQRSCRELASEKSEGKMAQVPSIMQEAVQNYWIEMVPPGNLLHWHGGEYSYGSTMCHIRLTHLEANISICITEINCYPSSIVPIWDNLTVFLFNDSFIDFSHKFIKYHTSIKLSIKESYINSILNNNQSEICFTETLLRMWCFRLSYHGVSALRETFTIFTC